MTVEETSTIEVRFPTAYDPVTAEKHAQAIRNYYSNATDLIITNHSHRAGELEYADNKLLLA